MEEPDYKLGMLPSSPLIDLLSSCKGSLRPAVVMGNEQHHRCSREGGAEKGRLLPESTSQNAYSSPAVGLTLPQMQLSITEPAWSL